MRKGVGAELGESKGGGRSRAVGVIGNNGRMGTGEA